MEKLRSDKLEAELNANREAVIQRSVMREKLEKFKEQKMGQTLDYNVRWSSTSTS